MEDLDSLLDWGTDNPLQVALIRTNLAEDEFDEIAHIVFQKEGPKEILQPNNSEIAKELAKAESADYHIEISNKDLEESKHEVNGAEEWPLGESPARCEKPNIVKNGKLVKIHEEEVMNGVSSSNKPIITFPDLETSSVTTNVCAMPEVEVVPKEIARNDSSIIESGALKVAKQGESRIGGRNFSHGSARDLYKELTGGWPSGTGTWPGGLTVAAGERLQWWTVRWVWAAGRVGWTGCSVAAFVFL
ncbi:hypothetical protein Cgig2_009393 [Carnegiea gigantea]|uniref:Uncharacterized protein n=1 Tax=Carnegiea gigantea TaxID=171969 RepID=A0A9Q1GJN1_9CARY|nr:hypothetical protein Cgig2_009393 [Carnegiea gigantea]